MPLGVDAAGSPDTIESITGEKKKKTFQALLLTAPGHHGCYLPEGRNAALGQESEKDGER